MTMKATTAEEQALERFLTDRRDEIARRMAAVQRECGDARGIRVPERFSARTVEGATFMGLPLFRAHVKEPQPFA